MKHKILFLACFLLLIMLPMMAQSETKNVTDFEGLKAALENSTDTEIIIHIQQNSEITLSDCIVVNKNLQDVKIFLHGSTINGDGHPFLKLKHEKTHDQKCNLTIQNEDSDAPCYMYDMDTYELTYDDSKMGRIINCKQDAGSGAVIFCDHDCEYSIVLNSISFENCEASDGGGVIHTRGIGELKAVGCRFINNKTLDSGGGVMELSLPSENTISYCLFSGNKALKPESSEGGAICYGTSGLDDTPATLAIEYSVFKENESAEFGGAIYQTENGDIFIKHCLFDNNKAVGGGAINVSDSTDTEITDSLFINNQAILDADDYYGEGGALYVSPQEDNSNAKILIKNSTFSNNSAESDGGAIYVNDEISFTMDGGSIIEKNKASICGGGVYLSDSAEISVVRGKITNNTARLGGGVLVESEDASFSINNVEIADNTADKWGQDVLLVGDAVITIAGDLGTYQYDVAKYDPAASSHTGGVITAGLPGKGTVENFKSSEGYGVLYTDGKEALLGFADVTVNAGNNMTKTSDSGEAAQTDLAGAMTAVVYTAAEGYWFPEDYSVAAVNGITVTRNSATQITVSGTPTADTEITLPDAVLKPETTAIPSATQLPVLQNDVTAPMGTEPQKLWHFPKTGDDANPILWIVMTLAGAAGIGAIIWTAKKRRK